jgi:hypothetical protein
MHSINELEEVIWIKDKCARIMKLEIKNNIITALPLSFVIIGLGFCLWSLCPKTDEPTAKRVLSSYGFTKVEFTGSSFTGCGVGDSYRTRFDAKGADGASISGIVCGGIVKGNTVRLY